MTEIFIALIGALTGGGLTSVFYWRANRRKAEGEAKQTEADAMKSVQDVYQQALADQQKYITQLRETRDNLVADREEMRRENNELRKRLNDMDDKVRKLEKEIDRNAKMIISLRPFLCGRLDCHDRISVELSNDENGEEATIIPSKKPRKAIK